MRTLAAVIVSWIAVLLFCLVPAVALVAETPATGTSDSSSESSVSENQSSASDALDVSPSDLPDLSELPDLSDESRVSASEASEASDESRVSASDSDVSPSDVSDLSDLSDTSDASDKSSDKSRVSASDGSDESRVSASDGSENQSGQSVTPKAPVPSGQLPRLLGPDDAAEKDERAVNRPDVQALARGPVHEAFAEQVNLDPRAMPVIRKRPPEPVNEVPPEIELEGENVRWIAGYWAWDDEQEDFVWVSGLWRNVPPGRRWVPGYWVEVEDGYQWIQGTWAPDEAVELSVREPPPDSLERGPNSTAPSEQHIWIPGGWVDGGGGYRWRAGFWARGHDDWIWVPERYLWRPTGCIYVTGYWDYPVVRRGILFAPCRFYRPVYVHEDYRYSPSVVLNVGHVFAHLFVRPRYCHYYFGDYYANDYGSHGYYPWHQYYENDYCPLLTHYRWHHHRRGFNYLRHLHGVHDHLVAHAHQRPHRQFQHHRKSDHHGAQRAKHHAASDVLKHDSRRGRKRRVASELGTPVEHFSRNTRQSKRLVRAHKGLGHHEARQTQQRSHKVRPHRANSSKKGVGDGPPVRTRRKPPTTKGPRATASRVPKRKEGSAGPVRTHKRIPPTAKGPRATASRAPRQKEGSVAPTRTRKTGTQPSRHSFARPDWSRDRSSRDRSKSAQRYRSKIARTKQRGSGDATRANRSLRSGNDRPRPNVAKRSGNRSPARQLKRRPESRPSAPSSRSRKTVTPRTRKVSPRGKSPVPRQSFSQPKSRSGHRARATQRSSKSHAKSPSARSSGGRSGGGRGGKGARGGHGGRAGRKGHGGRGR